MEFEEKAPSNNKTFCCVYGCASKAARNRTLSFHLFPMQGKRKIDFKNQLGITERLDIHKAWMLKLKMGKPASKFMRVCSLHFTSGDYKLIKSGSNFKKHLKWDAVPTMNLPRSSVPSREPIKRKTRKSCYIEMKGIQDKKASDDLAHHNIDVKQPEDPEDPTKNEYTEKEKLVAEALLSLCQKKFNDIGVQVNTSAIRTISQLIVTDEQLNSITGLHSFKLLDTIEQLVSSVHSDQRTHTLIIRDRIILTFLKLKNDISYVVLSILFGGVSSQTCKAVFFEMIPIISKVLSPAIFFPSKEEILSNLPKCFKYYSNVRIVLDCTEIFVQKPKCLCCRIKTYSHYKSGQTLKFLVGVSPAGLITFVSKCYGGRASDKSIFAQSQLIQKLIPHKDAIMVDKGFLIDEICNDYGIKLIRPPFLRKKKQLSSQEAKINACIASARVHIERVNQRIKIFRILNSTMNWSLAGLVDHIFLIICAICNLSKPILAEERF